MTALSLLLCVAVCVLWFVSYGRVMPIRLAASPDRARYDGAGASTRRKGTATMGDKSPKAAKKQASQKQAKSARADQLKRQEVAAKQVPRK